METQEASPALRGGAAQHSSHVRTTIRVSESPPPRVCECNIAEAPMPPQGHAARSNA